MLRSSLLGTRPRFRWGGSFQVGVYDGLGFEGFGVVCRWGFRFGWVEMMGGLWLWLIRWMGERAEDHCVSAAWWRWRDWGVLVRTSGCCRDELGWMGRMSSEVCPAKLNCQESFLVWISSCPSALHIVGMVLL